MLGFSLPGIGAAVFAATPEWLATYILAAIFMSQSRWPFSFLYHMSQQISWSHPLWLRLPPPICVPFVFWWLTAQAPDCWQLDPPTGHLTVRRERPGRRHRSTLLFWRHEFVQAKLGFPGPPVQLHFKTAMTDGDPGQHARKLPRSTATVSPHIPVFIYEGQEEQEGSAAAGAAVKRSDFSFLKDAHLRWAGVRVKYCWWEFFLVQHNDVVCCHVVIKEMDVKKNSLLPSMETSIWS